MKHRIPGPDVIVAALLLCAIIALGHTDTSLARRLDLPPSIFTFLSGVFAVAALALFHFRRQREDRLKSQFISLITHTFRASLTKIGWVTDVLTDEPSSAKRKELLFEIKSSKTKLDEMVGLLADFTRLDSTLTYTYAKVSLYDLVSKCAGDLAGRIAEKGIDLSIDLPSDPLSIIADSSKIQFAIYIVLDNAVKYTPPQGKIRISAQKTPTEVSLSISDSGIGIPRNDIDKVSRRFYRSVGARKTDSKGLGLGLYMTRVILDKHKGNLAVKSSGDGKGTEVTLSLPSQ